MLHFEAKEIYSCFDSLFLKFKLAKEKPPWPIFDQQINLIIPILLCSSFEIKDVCTSFTISLKILQLAIFEM